MDTEPGEPQNCPLSQLRADVPLANEYIYLNSCTFGPVLQSVQLTAAALNELGTANYSLRIGAGACIETAQRTGLETMEEHCRKLTERLRAGLRRVPGISVASPDAWEHSSSVTTVQLHEGAPARCLQLVERLLDDYCIVVKYRPEICGVRIGVAAFNTTEEIDQFLTAIDHLAPQV